MRVLCPWRGLEKKRRSKMSRNLGKLVVEGEEMVGEEPVSPTGEYFSGSVLSLSILAVFESEKPIDVGSILWGLEHVFLPINPRFFSIMVRDKHGLQRWKKVEVKLENHIIIPTFPPGLACYDDCLQDYLSKITLDQFPPTQPLWNLHLVKYPTSNAAGLLVFKFQHALGDGFSLMGALFACLRRADDPSLPLSFPSSRAKSTEDSKWNSCNPALFFSMWFNMIRDFSWIGLRKDSKSPIRSAAAGVEFQPITLSSIEFSLTDIKVIKEKLRVTVNDVMTGIIFYGIRLYIEAVGQRKLTKATNATALVLLNTRAIKAYQSLEEMNRADSKSRWGNQIAFLHVPIPKWREAETATPIEFVLKAKRSIKARRNSTSMYLTNKLLEMLRKFRGPEAAARYIHAASRNTSMGISNMIGPQEQVQMEGHPIKGMYFMVVGIPQSLAVTLVSYMGKMRLALGAEKGFINSQLLVSCMEKSFQMIFEAANIKE